MKKPANAPLRFASLSEAHRFFGLPKPLHPLISLVKGVSPSVEDISAHHWHVLSFYKFPTGPS